MAIANETVTVAVCDACGKRTYGDPGKQPAVITGNAQDLTGQLEKNGTWSACGPKHVGNAVANVLKAAQPVRTPFTPVPNRPTVAPQASPERSAG